MRLKQSPDETKQRLPPPAKKRWARNDNRLIVSSLFYHANDIK
jgi:hypothetical protein